jgi:hypothetical protein
MTAKPHFPWSVPARWRAWLRFWRYVDGGGRCPATENGPTPLVGD